GHLGIFPYQEQKIAGELNRIPHALLVGNNNMPATQILAIPSWRLERGRLVGESVCIEPPFVIPPAFFETSGQQFQLGAILECVPETRFNKIWLLGAGRRLMEAFEPG